MNLDPALLEILACPACHAELRVDDAASQLVCTGCGLAYPVRDDIPVLLVDDLIDSRWTMTVAGSALRQAGATGVLPFALASSA